MTACCAGASTEAEDKQLIGFCSGCTFPMYGPGPMPAAAGCLPCYGMGSPCNMCDCMGRCNSCSFGFRQYNAGCVDSRYSAAVDGGPALAPGPALQDGPEEEGDMDLLPGVGTREDSDAASGIEE